MAIVTGGVLAEHGEAMDAHRAVMRSIREYAPRLDDEDYAVDIAFVTGDDVGPTPPPIGVTPGPVGRTQRRFIVWHRLPKGLVTEVAVRDWFVETLPQTEALVRTHLPQKSRSYPADRLADEVVGLRLFLDQR
jgi:hypothetical protein